MTDIHVLVGKALSDPEFARKLVEQPEATLLEAGVTPTPELLDILGQLDVAALQRLAGAFGEGKAA